MEFEDIERILELVRQHELVGVRARARRAEAPAPKGGYELPGAPAADAAGAAAGDAARAPPRLPAPPAAAPPTPAEETALELAVVKSPIVGTFYRVAEPGAAAVRGSRAAGEEGSGALHHRGDEADERDHVRVRRRNRERLRGKRQAGPISANGCSRSRPTA